ncbi:amidase [Fodinicurvata fenggangensis]|uniref:amidase n=1 Tax=Fodinicurvata fenggangensis TaxID=1121830 RepID=UPI00068AD546|nr:amidase [Fodinicurvata fenggangensis]
MTDTPQPQTAGEEAGQATGHDPLNAFMPGTRLTLPPNAPGSLSGLEFAVKDIYDIAGHVTGCGNPDYRRTHGPAETTATSVTRLLDAGAAMVGKVLTDEFAYSLSGQNPHYGAAANSNAPGRTTGGSSCGSAAAVAGGLCDSALGTDTGGSVRIPASYCGLYGLRPTHGRIPIDGVAPLAPSFDTVGWFARDPETFRAVGEVLLGADEKSFAFDRLLYASEAFARLNAEVAAKLEVFVERLEMRLGKRQPVSPAEADGGLDSWSDGFRHLQAAEAWDSYGPWIQESAPTLGPELQARMTWAKEVAGMTDKLAQCRALMADVRTRLDSLLGDDALMVLPTAPDIAPLLGTDADTLFRQRLDVMAITSYANLSGLPQVSLPVTTRQGCPLGLSLIGPRGSDRALLEFAESFARSAGF